MWVVVLTVIVALCFWFLSSCIRKKKSLEVYEQDKIRELTHEVSAWPSTRPSIVESIEAKHGTVTVKKVEVEHFSVQTIDGGRVVYGDGDNLSEYKLILRFWWDGILHEDGHTDVGFIFDKDGEPVKSWTEESDALLDLDDPEFWGSLGYAIGTLLAL